MKTFNATDTKSSSTVDVHGNPDLWVLLCKASNQKQGWMKSTKAMDTSNGCLVQVTTEKDGQVSEALQFVPNVHIEVDEEGNKFLHI